MKNRLQSAVVRANSPRSQTTSCTTQPFQTRRKPNIESPSVCLVARSTGFSFGGELGALAGAYSARAAASYCLPRRCQKRDGFNSRHLPSCPRGRYHGARAYRMTAAQPFHRNPVLDFSRVTGNSATSSRLQFCSHSNLSLGVTVPVAPDFLNPLQFLSMNKIAEEVFEKAEQMFLKGASQREVVKVLNISKETASRIQKYSKLADVCLLQKTRVNTGKRKDGSMSFYYTSELRDHWKAQPYGKVEDFK